MRKGAQVCRAMICRFYVDRLCERACVRACVRSLCVCARACVCVHARVCVFKNNNWNFAVHNFINDVGSAGDCSSL